MTRNAFLRFVLFLIIASPVLPLNNSSRLIQVNPSEGITAFNTAVKAAVSGDTLVVNEGNYIFTDSLEILDKQGITIEGKGNVNFLLNNSSQNAINISNSSNITFKNIVLSNQADKNMISTNIGIYLEELGSISIINCKIENFGAGLYSNNSASVTIKACTIVNNNQWAVIGTFKMLNLIENDIENNGGLFYINEENIRSIGIEQKNIFMKDNISISNGVGVNNFMPVPLLNTDKNNIPSPLSQELSNDRLLQQNITDSLLQQDMIKNAELRNAGQEDHIFEDKNLLQDHNN